MLPENTAPFRIVAMVENLVTTDRAHGLATGHYVYLADVEGMTGANGYFQVTVIDSTHFTLNGAPVSGNYENSGGFTVTRTVSEVSNASPIVITTMTTHGFQTGQRVTVAGVEGNTAANGTWTITKVNDTQFSLDGSIGDGDYTTGGTAARWFVLGGCLECLAHCHHHARRARAGH